MAMLNSQRVMDWTGMNNTKPWGMFHQPNQAMDGGATATTWEWRKFSPGHGNTQKEYEWDTLW
jgi:hypothetical protein